MLNVASWAATSHGSAEAKRSMLRASPEPEPYVLSAHLLTHCRLIMSAVVRMFDSGEVHCTIETMRTIR